MDKITQLKKDYNKACADLARWEIKKEGIRNVYQRGEAQKMVDALTEEVIYLGIQVINQEESKDG